MRVIGLREKAEGHSAPITHVAFRGDGRRLATSSYDGTVIIWDVAEAGRLRQLGRLAHRRLVNSAAWHPHQPGLLATASADKLAAIWEVSEDGRAALRGTLARHTDDINSVAWMPDGERLICVSEDGRATLWDAARGRFLAVIAAHAAHCMMASVSRGGLVATVGEDGQVVITDPGGALAPVSRQYDCSVEGCAWSQHSERLAVARDDGIVEILAPDLTSLWQARVSTTSAARTVAWMAGDSKLAVGSYDGSFYFVDNEGGVCGHFHDDRAWPRSVAASGHHVALGSFWAEPFLLSAATGEVVCEPATPTPGPNAMTVADGRLLIGCDSGAVISARPASPQAGWAGGPPEASVEQPGASPVLALAAAGGHTCAATYSSEVVRLNGRPGASTRTGVPLVSLLGYRGKLVAGSYSGEYVVFDPATLALETRVRHHGGPVKGLALLDEDVFVSAATDRTVTAGDLSDRHVLWEHGNLVNAVATLGGCVVASASRDHTVKVGRVSRGGGGWQVSALQTLMGPDESVKCVGLLGDPARPAVVAGSYDFGLYAWCPRWDDGAQVLQEGRLIGEFRQGLSCICPLSGTELAVAGWDGRIAVVAMPGGEPAIVAEFTVADLLSQPGLLQASA